MKSISQVNFAFYFIMLKIGFWLKCLIRCQIICDVRICSKCPQFGEKKTLSIYSSYSSFGNQFIVKINRYTSRACIIQYNWNWPQNRKEKFSLGIKTESNPFRWISSSTKNKWIEKDVRYLCWQKSKYTRIEIDQMFTCPSFVECLLQASAIGMRYWFDWEKNQEPFTTHLIKFSNDAHN